MKDEWKGKELEKKESGRKEEWNNGDAPDESADDARSLDDHEERKWNTNEDNERDKNKRGKSDKMDTVAAI